MMSWAKATDFDTYRLFCAMHSHVYATLRSVLNMCHWYLYNTFICKFINHTNHIKQFRIHNTTNPEFLLINITCLQLTLTYLLSACFLLRSSLSNASDIGAPGATIGNTLSSLHMSHSITQGILSSIASFNAFSKLSISATL